MNSEIRFNSLEEALAGADVPKDIRLNLTLVDVPYLSFGGQECTGQMVVFTGIAHEVRAIFEKIFGDGFPIYSITPIAAYGWDDTSSMEANNTSAFNYRKIAGTDRISNHSHGLAIDINPLQNPYYARDGKVYPSRAAYDVNALGTLTPDSSPVARFKEYGWSWLGDRAEHTDYQHFEKVLSVDNRTHEEKMMVK